MFILLQRPRQRHYLKYHFTTNCLTNYYTYCLELQFIIDSLQGICAINIPGEDGEVIADVIHKS